MINEVKKLYGRKVLDNLVNFLNTKEGGLVWDIISALRSCDGEELDIKQQDYFKGLTTARIRAIIGLKGQEYNGKSSGTIAYALHTPLEKGYMESRRQMLEDNSSHFRDHYFNAVRAIQQLYDYDLIHEKPWKDL